MNDIICKRCGCTKMKFEEKGPHIGAYCEDCGSWVKWCSATDLMAHRKVTPSTLDGINPNYHNFDMDDIYGSHEQKEPSPYDGDDDDGCVPWEE